jgi:DNA-binding winged helix-turn-helix (wHTH) protein/tetratricopeptide (TPR) repeat protein
MLTEIRNVQFGDFLLDRRLRELRRGDAVLPISGRAFDLLSFMAANPGRPLSKAELLDAVWPDTAVEESNLSQCVFQLRKAMASGVEGPIKTLAGRGYQFVADVTEIDTTVRPGHGAAKLERLPSLAVEATETRVFVQQRIEEHISWRLSLGWILAGVLILAAAGVLGWRWRQRWLDQTSGPPVDVVLTPVDGSTGDPVLDRALLDALRMDLEQSPFVSFVSPSRLRATLTEMKQNPDGPMTAAIAREVCERTNSQAVLHGTVARLGPHFLLTEDATSCVDGSILAEAKQDAAAAEDLPDSMEKIAGTLRRKLGESRRSIARFDVPLFPANTASLEALKDYSQARAQERQSRYVDGIELLKKAVAADPGFAQAYYSLAAYYRSTDDFTAERQAILKAYGLRDSTSEPTRRATIALYHSAVTQDLYEAERNYQEWTELYPRSAQAWNGLSVVERDLGHHKEAAIAAQRALDLRPEIAGLYPNLSYEQRRTGDYKGSLATCERALARGLDTDYVRDQLLQTAYDLHDPALIQQQRDWAAAHPDAVYLRIEEAETAITEGRFKDAHMLIPQIAEYMRQHGQAGVADRLVLAEGINLVEVGDVAEGTRLIRSVPVDPKDDVSVMGMIRVGDFAKAESSLRAMQAEFPQGTIWNAFLGPQVQAIIALATHKPAEAIAALERSRPLDGRDPIIHMMLADAYLAAGDPRRAEEFYRQVVEGPVQDPDVPEVPLSWLGLGRALAAEGNRPAAIAAYQHFLTRWSHADQDAIYLKQAKQEFAKL